MFQDGFRMPKYYAQVLARNHNLLDKFIPALIQKKRANSGEGGEGVQPASPVGTESNLDVPGLKVT